MLKSCVDYLDVDNLFFVNSSWVSQEFLSSWWSYSLKETLPSKCSFSSYESLPPNSRLIALDLNILSPCDEAIYVLASGIPVVSLISSSISSRGTFGLLSSLGLESLSPGNFDIWMQTVEALVDDMPTYQQISSHLKSSFSSSLLCDYSLFVRDLFASISLLQKTNS